MQTTENSPTVLVVEDDPNIVHMVSIIMNKSGIKTVGARDGEHALEVLNHLTPNLIISDIMMPNMDGYAFRRELLERDEARFIPFFFLSAKGKAYDIVHGMELDADAYIPKPFDPDVLLAKVKSVLRRYSHLNELLQYDTLTKVYNRRMLENSLSAEIKRVKRYKQSSSILLLDLDHFKNINDTYGHDFGDVVLQKISAGLRDNMRDTDYVGRVGGEEFVIVMPNTEKKTGVLAANRLREKIEKLVFDKAGLHVTISGGVATVPDDAEDIEGLMKKADRALYKAKDKGRNCIVAAE